MIKSTNKEDPATPIISAPAETLPVRVEVPSILKAPCAETVEEKVAAFNTSRVFVSVVAPSTVSAPAAETEEETVKVPEKSPLTAVTLPEAETLPAIVNFSLGVSVPIPTFPPSTIANAILASS